MEAGGQEVANAAAMRSQVASSQLTGLAKELVETLRERAEDA